MATMPMPVRIDAEFLPYVHKDHADPVPGLASALSTMTEDGTKERLSEKEIDPRTLSQRLACK